MLLEALLFPFLALAVGWAVFLAWRRTRVSSTLPYRPESSILFVVSHPDDESMFFGPTIEASVRAGCEVRLLCLSNGNYDGLGRIREKELLRAGDAFGIPREHITVVSEPALQDDPRALWPSSAVVRALERHLRVIGPVDHVVTFDGYGVSGHANHRAVAQALLSHAATGDVPFALWTLQSLPWSVKFTGPAAALLLPALGYAPPVLCPSVRTVWRAMLAHWSQFTWYRALFLAFSAYPFVNVLRRV